MAVNGDQPSETFLTCVKLSLLRHCLASRSEEKLFFELSSSLSSLVMNKNPNPQLSSSEFYRNLMDNLDKVTKERLDRLLAVVENMKYLEQNKQEEYDQLLELKKRWEKTIEDLNLYDITKFKNKGDTIKNALSLISKSHPVFEKANKIHDEMGDLSDTLSASAFDQIKLILLASHSNQEGLSDVLLNNPCENIHGKFHFTPKDFQ